jgi:hypothetical protein
LKTGVLLLLLLGGTTTLKIKKPIQHKLSNYRILSSIVRTFLMENDAEIFPEQYKWKVAEKRFKMACVMNKLAMINSCEIILEK